MEILSEILRSMHVEGSVYFCDHLEAPWVKEFPGTDSAGFHMIRRGECLVTVGEQTEYMGSGDLIFLGPKIPHKLSSCAVAKAAPDHIVNTLLLCGYCRFATDTVTPLVDIIPQMTIIRDEELMRHPWLRSTFDQLSSEYMAQSPGAELVVNKLTEVILIELIRINFGRKEQNSFLLALNDKAISKALQYLHAEPHLPWTLERLAEKVAMSRAALAKRFKLLVGQPMFQYLTGLRMQLARDLLRDSGLPFYEIANRAGYQSDLSFRKTFKKHTGMTPKQFRVESAREKP